MTLMEKSRQQIEVDRIVMSYFFADGNIRC
jgi:hypothetical protein